MMILLYDPDIFELQSFLTDRNITISTKHNITPNTFEILDENIGYCPPPRKGCPAREFGPLNIYYKGQLIYTQNKIIQNEIVESIAGDNTYFQFSRKDPLIGGGIFNKEILKFYNIYTMKYVFKTAYSDYPEYLPSYIDKISEDGTVGIGVDIKTTIQNPHKICKHNPLPGESANTYRRYWHTWEPTPYNKQMIFNLWNNNIKDYASSINWPIDITADWLDSPTIKTIYDPSPPGYCVPHITAFLPFISSLNNLGEESKNYGITSIYNNGVLIAFDVKDEQGNIHRFPIVGCMDLGWRQTEYPPSWVVEKGFNAAHSNLIFLANSNLNVIILHNTCILPFYIDSRSGSTEFISFSTSNLTYGMSVRPIKEIK